MYYKTDKYSFYRLRSILLPLLNVFEVTDTVLK